MTYFKAKRHQIWFRVRLHWGAYGKKRQQYSSHNTPAGSLARFKGPTSNGKRKEREGRGEGDHPASSTFLEKIVPQQCITKQQTLICSKQGGLVEVSSDRTSGLLVIECTACRVNSRLRTLESQLASEQQSGPRQNRHKLAAIVIWNSAINIAMMYTSRAIYTQWHAQYMNNSMWQLNCIVNVPTKSADY